MAKKILAVVLIAIVAVSAAACFVACEEEPTPYADLVAVRVNNFMAEWENIDYNFTYEGSSALKVSVPYTNYLEVNDLIVSPEAEYKVYEDEGKTKQLTDLSEIYVDGAKTLYIDVTNGELSNSYSVDVTVEQTNLPPESEIADKQYDNRGGHIYIPDGAETVEVDGVVYNVVRDRMPLLENINYILAGDVYCVANPFDYSAIYNGNNYELQMSINSYSLVDELQEGGVIKNVVFVSAQFQDRPFSWHEYCHTVCNNNYGTIENVKTNLNCMIYQSLVGVEFRPITVGYFAQENHGTISNCINTGNIFAKKNNMVVETGAFVVEQYGEMNNCVNTGMVQHEFPYWEEYRYQNGAGAITFLTSEDAEFRGVFNVGECVNGQIDDKYIDETLEGLAFCTQVEGQYPDLSRAKNYR